MAHLGGGPRSARVRATFPTFAIRVPPEDPATLRASEPCFLVAIGKKSCEGVVRRYRELVLELLRPARPEPR